MNRYVLLFVLIPIIGYSQYSEAEWEARDSWMNVSEIFDLSNIVEGSHVADIGCHEGYLTVHLAHRVGKNGKVYAVDIEEYKLIKLKQNLTDRNLDNVAVILGEEDDPKLPFNSLDAVLIMDTYHEIEDYMNMLKHANDALKVGGRIIIVEKLKRRIKGSSRASQVAAHSLAPKYVKKELIDAGFTISYQNNDLGDWEKDSDKTIWILVGIKQ